MKAGFLVTYAKPEDGKWRPIPKGDNDTTSLPGLFYAEERKKALRTRLDNDGYKNDNLKCTLTQALAIISRYMKMIIYRHVLTSSI